MTQDAVPTPPAEPVAVSTPPAPAGRRPKNKLGIAALILTLLAAIAPLVIVIVVWIMGVTEYPDDFDNAVYVGFLGGFVFFFGTIALLSPLSFAGLVLGVVSMWRPGSKAPGIVAIILGVIGSIGLFGFPFVLGELVPGL
jgi:hypothetical protein